MPYGRRWKIAGVWEEMRDELEALFALMSRLCAGVEMSGMSLCVFGQEGTENLTELPRGGAC